VSQASLQAASCFLSFQRLLDLCAALFHAGNEQHFCEVKRSLQHRAVEQGSDSEASMIVWFFFSDLLAAAAQHTHHSAAALATA
jgi:hypothetical protein